MLSFIRLSVCLLVLSGHAFAQSVKIDKTDVWDADSVSFSKWVESSRDCAEWSPSTSDIDWGQPVRQSKTCRIEEARDRIETESNRLTKQTREKKRTLQTRLTKHTEWRTSSGELDRILSSGGSAQWTDWAVVPGTLSDCHWLTPMLSEHVDLGAPWVRLQQCVALRERRQPVFEYWLSGKVTRLTDQEPVEKSQGEVVLPAYVRGTHDRWVVKDPSYTVWSDTQEKQCAPWGVLDAHIKAQLWGVPYSVSRECDAVQQRIKTVDRVQISGKQERLSTEKETRHVTQREWQIVYGEQDSQIGSTWELVKDWSVDDETERCSPHPQPESIALGTPYLSYQHCEVDKTREFHYIVKYRSGNNRVEDRKLDVLPQSFSRIAHRYGEKDQLLSSSAKVRGTDWINAGDAECAGWQVSPAIISFGRTFIQHRECVQSRYRTVERLEQWASGERWKEIEKLDDSVRYVEVRQYSGSKVEQITSPDLSFTAITPETATSERFVVAGSSYHRVRVHLKAEDYSAVSGLMLYGPDGLSLPVALDAKRRGFTYVTLPIGAKSQGEWYVTLDASQEVSGRLQVSLMFLALPPVP